MTTEYTVHFQKGTRVGARSLRMETVDAVSDSHAIQRAKAAFPGARARGYRVVRVDHFDADGRLVIDSGFGSL